MNEANEDRNKDLVLKRLKDKGKWTWGKLGKLYGISRFTARDIFDRDVEKYRSK